MNRPQQIRTDFDAVTVLLDAVTNLALQEVEERARRILRQHPSLTSFVMAMGTAFFVTADGSTIRVNERAYMRQLEDFLVEWEGDLRLTGCPMRFTTEGELITDW